MIRVRTVISQLPPLILAQGLIEVRFAWASALRYATSASAMPIQDKRICFIRQLRRSEEHTSELQSLMRISYAVFCLKKKNTQNTKQRKPNIHKSIILK